MDEIPMIPISIQNTKLTDLIMKTEVIYIGEDISINKKEKKGDR